MWSAWPRSGFLGHWSLDWTSYVGALPSTAIVVFEVFDSLVQNDLAASSCLSARYADILATKPAAPVIEKYIPAEIGGTEATNNTAVVVHDITKQQDVNPAGATVTANSWDVKPTGSEKPDNGDEIYAVAWTVNNGRFGVNSDQSTPKKVDALVPPAPTITKRFPADIAGGENLPQQSDQMVTTIYIAKESDMARTPVGNSGHLTGMTWEINPVTPPRTPGELMVAWAQTDAGAKSLETTFTIVSADKPIPPSIGNWSDPNVQGSGWSGTTVELFLNDQSMGTNVVNASRSWTVNVGTTPATGDHLKAVATNVDGTSDPYTITVGSPRAQLVMDDTAITTASAGGTVDTDNQMILAWRQSDGLLVVQYPVGTAGAFTATYLSGSNIQSGDLLMFTSQTNDGDPEAMMSTYQGQQVT
nr:hypothetical protein [Marinicella sp. W31]MDC2879883.1 hypothetical protein [Marinicella sp. W31]